MFCKIVARSKRIAYVKAAGDNTSRPQIYILSSDHAPGTVLAIEEMQVEMR